MVAPGDSGNAHWDQREKGRATGESCEAGPGLVEAQVTVPADWGPSRPLAWGRRGVQQGRRPHGAHSVPHHCGELETAPRLERDLTLGRWRPQTPAMGGSGGPLLPSRWEGLGGPSCLPATLFSCLDLSQDRRKWADGLVWTGLSTSTSARAPSCSAHRAAEARWGRVWSPGTQGARPGPAAGLHSQPLGPRGAVLCEDMQRVASDTCYRVIMSDVSRMCYEGGHRQWPWGSPTAIHPSVPDTCWEPQRGNSGKAGENLNRKRSRVCVHPPWLLGLPPPPDPGWGAAG